MGSYLARLKNLKFFVFLGSCLYGSEAYWLVSDMEVACFVTCTVLYCTCFSVGLLFSWLINGSLC